MTEQNTVEKIREFNVENNDEVPDVTLALNISDADSDEREELARELVRATESVYGGKYG